MLLRIALFTVLAGLTSELFAQTTPPPNRAARIEQLIRQLGDEQFAVREAAAKALLEIGNPAREALTKATASTDAEVAQRSRSLLEKLPRVTHTLLDALGQPIPHAAVTLYAVGTVPPAAPGVEPAPTPDSPAPIPLVSDEEGRFGVPESEEGVRLTARVEHADYGVARCPVEAGKDRLIVPLVRAGSEGRRRALAGQVTTQGGQPVAGAVVVCDNIRTPGEGLIEPLHPPGEVLTGDDGRFAIYPPSEDRNRQRGELIPPNSRYSLIISVPGDDAFLPLAALLTNTAPARVVLTRATRLHRFRFEDVRGGWIEDPAQWSGVHVQLERLLDGERTLVKLDPASLAKGRKLLPGKYVAQRFMGSQKMEYQPIVIAENSPEQLDFRLAPAVTYQGSVVSGVTGEPVAGAFVMGFYSTSRNNLALLTADDWKVLTECPSSPPDDHAAVKRLGDFYGVQGLVRTGEDGRFQIRCPPDREFWGLLAFAQDQLPFQVRVGSLKPDDSHRVDAGQFPLFPAAKVLVRPVFAGERLAVSPLWLPDSEGQPDWFAKFRTAHGGSDRHIAYVHWLTINELQPIHVPADVRLRLRFESPYDDKWTPASIAEPLRLAAAASKEIGDVHFAAALPAAVRVVNARGEPVEGFAVRRMYKGENAWSLAHNTDQQGLAHFYLHPNSQGEFRITDLAGPKEITQAKNLVADFQVESTAPPAPFQITVTDDQIKLLRGQ